MVEKKSQKRTLKKMEEIIRRERVNLSERMGGGYFPKIIPFIRNFINLILPTYTQLGYPGVPTMKPIKLFNPFTPLINVWAFYVSKKIQLGFSVVGRPIR